MYTHKDTHPFPFLHCLLSIFQWAPSPLSLHSPSFIPFFPSLPPLTSSYIDPKQLNRGEIKNAGCAIAFYGRAGRTPTQDPKKGLDELTYSMVVHNA